MLAMLACAATAYAAPFEVEVAEKLLLAATPGHAKFEAFGRRFSLTLESNERALAKLSTVRKAELAPFHLLRGRVDGKKGSWVRLTEFEGHIEGAIWDGEELYAVTSYAAVADVLTKPMTANADQTVIYRLADTVGVLPENFCGLATHDAPVQVTPQDQYKSLVQEMRAQAIAAAVLGDQIEISLIADGDFEIRTGSGSALTASLMYRYNIVEGIFAEQVGVLILASDIRSTSGPGDPFTSSNPNTLLNQLSTYRNSTAAVRQRGLAHLITGKDLTGGIAGIANVDALCDATRGVSLSQGTAGGPFGGIASALVMAHELGHNFGARHDGEAPCAGTPTDTYLMSAYYSGSAEFSACSVTSMAPAIAAARGRCVSPAMYADTETLPFGNNLPIETNTPAVIPVQVRNSGNQAATNATVVIEGSAGFFVIDSVSATGASCALTGDTTTCTYPSIPVGETRDLAITVRATIANNFILSVTTDASNDAFESNNQWRANVLARSSVDAGIAFQVNPMTTFIGEDLHLIADVSPQRSQGLSGSVVTFNVEGVTPTAYSSNLGTCTFQPGRATCTLADVPKGQTAHIDVTATAVIPGVRQFVASVQTPTDDNEDNNAAVVQNVRLQAVRDAELSVPQTIDVVAGATQEVQFAVTSPGRETVNDASIELFIPTDLTLVSVSVDGVACPPAVIAGRPKCSLGNLPAGATRTVRVQFRAPFATVTTISANLYNATGSQLDLDGLNNYAQVRVQARFQADALVLLSSGWALEGVETPMAVTIRAYGYEAAHNVVAVVEVPAALRITAASFNSAIPHTWICTLETAQRARCTTPTFGPDATQELLYTVISDTPGTYNGQVTVSADDDGNPTNNTANAELQIAAYTDVAMSGLSGHLLFQVGQSREFQLTLTSGRRPVPNVIVRAPNPKPYLELESITSPGIACTIETTQGTCNFGTVPANASIPITVRYRGMQDYHQNNSVLEAAVFTSNDVNYENNHTRAEWEVGTPTDLAIATATHSATATVGGTLAFPQITITNGASSAFEPLVEITIPSFLSIGTISASNAICTGTSLLQCRYGTLAPGASVTITLSLNALAVGSQSVPVRVTSSSDNNSSNDAIAVDLTVSSAAVTPPVTPPAPSPSGGGGGGGRFEWLALGFLALLSANRTRRLRRQPA
jgi:hypothetical protein